MLSRGPCSISLFVLAAFTASVVGCGGGEGLTFPPTTGTLVVVTNTAGEEPDPDGYTVQMDTEAPQAIGPTAQIQRNEVQPGEHSVLLTGLAANCSVAGDSRRTVRIVAGQTQTAQFDVTCSLTTGSVAVTTSSGGSSVDPDGYSLILDGIDRGPISAAGQVTVGGLTPGSHVTGLGGVAGNCQIQGDNLRTVTVSAGASTPVDYVISCVAPPPGAGTLRITTVTTGSDPDADGYAYALDGDDRQPIGPNAVATLTNLSPGIHRVRLSDIADNCRLEGDNPRSATVPAGGTGDLTFTIACSRATGTIRVTTSTTGASQDANGYVITLDGAAPGRGIGVDGTERFTDVPVGPHQVVLGDVASNCVVNEGPSRTVSVTLGGTTEVRFAVTCSQPQPVTGSVRVQTRTQGVDQDPDGYELLLDGGSRGDIGPNQERVLSDLAAGDHTLELRGVAANCQVTGENPRTVTVTAGQETTSSFDVTCTEIPATTGSITVQTDTDGADQDADGYELLLDGASQGAIESNGERSFSDLSPGDHTLQLTGLADNCTVDNNPRTVTVTAGQETTSRFEVTCTALPPTTGSIRVTTNTAGSEPDTDGYELFLDGVSQGTIGSNAEQTLSDLSPALHTVELRGIASNCTVGNNPRDVAVTAGQETTTDFVVSCLPTTGTVTVQTTTDGEEADADGYQLLLDGAAAQAIGPNGQTSFPDLSEGSHTVELSGVASNCSVQNDPNPRTVMVVAGQDVATTFQVTCSPSTGVSAQMES